MSGPADKVVSADCVNQGTVRWSDNASLSLPSAATFYNSGQFILQTNCTVSGQGTFQNDGTVLVPAGSGTVPLVIGDGIIFGNRGTLRAETNAVLELQMDINSGGLTLEDGTVFDGDGLVRLAGNGSCGCAGTLQVDTTVELAGPFCVEPAVLTGRGLFRWLSGTVGSFTFGQGFQVQMSGPADKVVSADCVNLGTVHWSDNASLSLPSAATFENSGQFILQTNCTVSGQGTFQNNGTVLVPAGSGTVPLVIGDGLNFGNRGTLRAETNAVLELQMDINSGGLTLEDGTVFNGEGLVRLAGNGSCGCLGTLEVDATVELAGPFCEGPAVLAGPGLFRWLSGTLASFTFNADTHLEAAGPADKYLGGDCANLGSFRWLGPSAVVASQGGGTLENSGLLSFESACTWDPGIALHNLPGGILRQVAGQSSFGALANDGTLELSAGTLSLDSLVCGSQATCRWTLSSTNPGTGFSPLQAGSLSFNGVLAVTLTNGFTPAEGAGFVLVTNVNASGRFTATALPSLASGLLWRLLYHTNDLTLKVATPAVLTGSAQKANGSFQFTLSNGEGGGYQIQASTNLTDWVTLLTNGPFSGPVTLTDTNAFQFHQRFYRARISD